MAEFHLTGLVGSNPCGAMAAFGLLRVVAEEQLLANPRLHWRQAPHWHPILSSDDALEFDTLLDRLVARHPKRAEANYFRLDDIKMKPPEWTAVVEDVLRGFIDTNDREELDFYSAFAVEVAKAGTDDVKPTALHMTAGQQKFLKSARELCGRLNPDVVGKRQKPEERWAELRERYREALIGPWTYQDEQHSLGWDPQTESLYALSATAPTKSKPTSAMAAVWLAFESLPLLPVLPGYRSRRSDRLKLLTTAFAADDGDFTWPIWESRITLATLRRWLQADWTGSEKSQPRGIVCHYRSEQTRDGNGRGTFRHAQRVSPGGADA